MTLRTLFLISSLALSGCGVKGKPLPPLNPPPIGDGTLKGQKKKPPVPAVRTAPNEEQGLGGK